MTVSRKLDAIALKRKVRADNASTVLRLCEQGMSYKDVANELGIAASTVSDIYQNALNERQRSELPSRVKKSLLNEPDLIAFDRSGNPDPKSVATIYREKGAHYFLMMPNLGRGSLKALVGWLKYHGHDVGDAYK